jgi:hypothetical protein
MLEVGRPVSLRKLAMLLVGTLKSPKLWNKLTPPPGLVPPVMLYCVDPPTGMGPLTVVFRPEEVIGGVCADATCSQKGQDINRVIIPAPVMRRIWHFLIEETTAFE